MQAILIVYSTQDHLCKLLNPSKLDICIQRVLKQCFQVLTQAQPLNFLLSV